MLFKFLGLVVKTLTGDGKYSLLNKDNFTRAFQMELSWKQKTISQFFSGVLKRKLNFEHFRKKDDLHSCCISDIT